jgi:SMC interacting uncharacterized protein involved in chromosome segregation
VSLDPSKLERHEHTKTDGVEIHVFMSPYDVPEAVRGRFDPSSRRFVIEFKYLDEEKATDEPHGEYIVLRVGKNSKRLLGLQINVEALKERQVGVRVFVPNLVASIRKAIGELSKTRHLQPSRLRNYEVAEEVIADRSEQLFKELVEAQPAS